MTTICDLQPDKTKKTKMKTTSDLLSKLLMEIFSKLPAKSVMRFRCLSHSFNNLPRAPCFISLFNESNLRTANLFLHTDENEEENEEENPNEFKTLEFEFLGNDECQTLNLQLPSRVSVLGSCNGIFCLLGDQCQFMSFFNPSTREHTELRIVINGIPDLAYMMVFPGFGYVPGTDEYKVVLIAYDDGETKVIVFTTRTNSWRRVEVHCPDPLFRNEVGVHVAGYVHWLLDFSTTILSFDLTNDVFREIPGPNFDMAHNSRADLTRVYELCVIDGCLVMFCMFHDGPSPKWFDVWKLTANGVGGSWERLFSMGRDLLNGLSMEPVFICKNGEILLRMGHDKLYLYDQVANTVRLPAVRGVPEHFHVYTYFDALTCIPPTVAGNRLEG